MPRARVGGIELEYETFGVPGSAPLLLISGLGSQLVGWDEAFCETLVSHGFRVIRFDNRDVGLSTKMEGAGRADVRAAVGGDPKPAYTLDDMAADAVGLLDAIGIPAAHVVGASMGGFIAQLVALNHPEHVLSLTSIMSGPSGSDHVVPTPEASALLLLPAQPTRQLQVEQAMLVRKASMGSLDPFDQDYELSRAERAIDRSYYPAGFGRQLVSLLAAPSRLERLRSLRMPVLVIHGLDDTLIPPANGRLVAASVPGARLIEFEGMGHDVPRRVWSQVAEAIAELARQATTAA